MCRTKNKQTNDSKNLKTNHEEEEHGIDDIMAAGLDNDGDTISPTGAGCAGDDASTSNTDAGGTGDGTSTSSTGVAGANGEVAVFVAGSRSRRI